MRLRILAVGRLKNSPVSALIEEYRKRLRWPLTIEEVEARTPIDESSLKSKEAALLRKTLDGKPAGRRIVIALDETGQSWTSAQFASKIIGWRDHGIVEATFLIGGADGLDGALLSQADVRLSLGRMTWPHALARALLVEQIYRAQQIASGHPYHRA
jgi:23S rRNA (pseudouridine1915-N3)-methyltransferase